MQHSDCNTPTRCAHAVYNSFGIWPAYELVLKMPKKTLLHNLTSKFNFTPANQNGSAERLRIFDWLLSVYPGGEVSVVFFCFWILLSSQHRWRLPRMSSRFVLHYIAYHEWNTRFGSIFFGVFENIHIWLMLVCLNIVWNLKFSLYVFQSVCACFHNNYSVVYNKLNTVNVI